MTPSFLQIALDLARAGWYVFPCKPGDKSPLTPHGFHDASVDLEQIRAWWTKEPRANIGIACGNSGLCVLDADHGLTDLASFRAWREAAGLPSTLTIRTGRRPEYGVQLYFKGPIPDVGLWELAGCSGQIKSLGGYVMAAGSIHPSGATYEPISTAEIQPTPDVVKNLRTSQKVGPRRERGSKIAPGDGQHAFLTSVAGGLRNKGLERDALEAALIPINESELDPPLPAEDVRHIAESVCKLYDVPEPDPVVVVKASEPEPEAAPLREKKKVEYPFQVWSDTVVGAFANLCALDNNIPRKLFAEAFRCALGAAVGDKIICDADGALPRSYTVIIAPKGKGKGTAIRRAIRFFSVPWYDAMQLPGLLSGERDFIWKSQGIGAWISAASSVPGMARLCKELKTTEEKSPHLTWKDTLPRIISIHEEMKTFLSTLFIEGGVGSGMEGVICQLLG